MTCLNCDSLQCVTVNRESYSWLIVAYCSQSPTFICPIVSFATLYEAPCTCVLKQEISLGSSLTRFAKKRNRLFFPYSRNPFLIYLVGSDISGEEEKKEKKRKMEKRSVQKRTPIVRYHRFDEKFLFVIGGISPVYRYFTASPYYK